MHAVYAKMQVTGSATGFHIYMLVALGPVWKKKPVSGPVLGLETLRDGKQ